MLLIITAGCLPPNIKPVPVKDRMYKNADGIRVTLPIHSGKIIHPKILLKIAEDTGIPLDEF